MSLLMSCQWSFPYPFFLSSHVTLPMWLKNLAKSHRYLLRRTMWLKNLVKSVRYLLRRSWLVFWCFQVPYTCIPRGYLWVTVIFVRSSITHIFLLRQCHVSLVGSSLSFEVCKNRELSIILDVCLSVPKVLILPDIRFFRFFASS